MIAPDSNKREDFKRALLSWETKHSILLVKDGKFYQVFKVQNGKKKISPWACWINERFCDKILLRPHLTCFSCRIRRVMGEELPRIIEVMPYTLLIPKNRGRLRSFLGKKFCTLAERFNR